MVTGHDASGKSMFVSDDNVAPLPTIGFLRLWGGDATPQLPDDGTLPEHHAYFPPVGGFRFGMFSLSPDGGTAETGAGLVDFEGTVVLEPDDGAGVTLHPGDTVVQNGAEHSGIRSAE